MQALLTQASNALSRNDSVALEALCAQALTAAPANTAASQQALLVLQRQVLAARSNLVLRQRLLAVRTGGAAPWAR